MSLLLFLVLAVQLGTPASDEPARSPQLVSSGPMVCMTYGAGKGIYFRASRDSGGLVVLSPGATQTTLLSRSGTAPALAALEDGSALAAWEDNGMIKTKRVP